MAMRKIDKVIIKRLLKFITSGTRYQPCSPYAFQVVRDAMNLIAEQEGKEHYLDVKWDDVELDNVSKQYLGIL